MFFQKKVSRKKRDTNADLPSEKEFRDLKPQNKKRRKTPPKPWGKKERFIVLSVLLTTVGLSGGLALNARSWKPPGLNRIKIGLPKIDIFKSDPIVVESEKGDEGDKFRGREVESVIRAKMKNLSGVYGVFVLDLTTGFSYGVNQTESFQAASLIKLPVIAALYVEAELGKVDLKTAYSLKDKDKIRGSGSLASKPEGTIYTYQELADLMGQESDNTAYGVIIGVLGDSIIKRTISDVGMSNTSLDNNITSPKDVGVFFEKLWNNNIVTESYTNKILSLLTDTIYEDWLAKDLPGDIRVAHKFGRELHVINDAGIVYADDPFVLVILSKGIIEKEADEFIPEVARIVYEAEVSK